MKLKIYKKVQAIHYSTKTSIISNSYSTKTKPKFRPKSSKASLSKDAEKELSLNKEKHRLKPQLDLVKGEIIYGIYPVLMALKSGKRHINEVYYNKNTERVGQVVELAKTKNIAITSTSPSDLQILARNSTVEKNSHQGICAYVSKVLYHNMKVVMLHFFLGNSLILFFFNLFYSHLGQSNNLL